MSLRKIAAVMTAICFTFGLFLLQPGAARSEVSPTGAGVQKTMPAGDASTAKAGEQQAAFSLEQAIKTAKEALIVPEGFDQFSTGFNKSDKQAFWELRWYHDGEPGGSMNVRVNAETGEIWGMDQWKSPPPGQAYRGLPKYTREQALGIAEALAAKLQPGRFKETRLQPWREPDYPQPLFARDRGPVMYYYNFARVTGGVTYPGNGINIAINGDTGEINSFNLNWDESTEFPPAAGCIAPAQAEQVFRAESAPALYYFRPHIPGGKEVPLQLVYRLPEQEDQVLIDALTGKSMNKDGKYYGYYDQFRGGAGGGEPYMKSANMADRLSPVEEVAVEEAKNLISMDKALETARFTVKVPQGFTLQNSRLEQDYLFKDKKTWNFSWQGGEGENLKWMNAAVDAVSGELVSFNIDRYSKLEYLKAPQVKFSEEAARKIAEEYIKKIQPGKWGQVEFKSSRPEMGPVIDGEKPQPRSYNFNWARIAKGVQFPENGFYLDVDSSTGEITRYQVAWWDLDFPDPQGVITRESAAGKYLQEAPLTLTYMRLWPRDGWMGGPREAKIQLVYTLARRDFAMLDAFTGQPLDQQGEPVSKSGEKVKFSDLVDHPAREAVELLARAGIIDGYDGKFRPDEVITQAELIAMLVKSSGQRPEVMLKVVDGSPQKGPWYQPYYNAAARTGIIQTGEQPDPYAPATREILARLAIHSMGLYQAARFGDIYVLNFQDAGEISEHLRGHAALSAALGLIEPVDGKFLPRVPVSRAEAAETLVRLLDAGK